MAFKGPFNDGEFLDEIWILFGIGTLTILIRYAVRIRTVGIRNLQGDDYMMLAVQFCYAADAIAVTYSYLWGTNLDWTEQQLIDMTPEDRRLVVIGSRMQLLAWYTYSILIWGLKGSMLFFFKRLTLGLEQAKFIKWIAIACAATWLGCAITYSSQCYPIQKNWQLIPMPPKSCTHKLANVYVSTVFNVLTDAAILCVPLPLIYKLRVTWKRKIALCLMLSSGIFVISAAIVRIVFTLQQASVLNINRWGVRETIAGILAVNIPIIRPIFKREFWRPGPFQLSEVTSHDPSSRNTAARSSKPMGAATHYHTGEVEMVDRSARVYRERKRKGPSMSAIAADSDSDLAPDGSSHTSQEYIIQVPGESQSGRSTNVDLESGESERWDPNGIVVETSYDVRPDTAPPELPDNGIAGGIYCGPDYQTNIHGNRIDIRSDSRPPGSC